MLPLQGTIGQRTTFPRPMPGRATDKHVYFPGAPVGALVAPNTYNRPHTITAEVRVPDGGAEGVIYALGSNAGGYALFVKDGKLTFVYNYEGHQKYRIVVRRAAARSGDRDHPVRLRGHRRDPDFANGRGAPGTGILAVNGAEGGRRSTSTRRRPSSSASRV